MRITVIDGQGGSIGKQVVKLLLEEMPDAEITAVGTNSVATSNMIKAGCNNAATGENAVLVACRKSDIIVGPIGIVIADALAGEISPAMAKAIAQSDAKRILIPFNNCDSFVIGVQEVSMSKLISQAIEEIKRLTNDTKRL